jgi:hypothetical protein
MINLAYGAANCVRLNDSDTTNALGKVFSTMRHIPLTLDDPKKGEIKDTDNSWFLALVKRFVAGQDKTTLTRSRAINTAGERWSTMLSITSNFNIIHLLNDQSVRRVVVQDVPLLKFPNRGEGPRWLRGLEEHGGAIMHEMLKWLMLHPDVLYSIEHRLALLREKFFQKYKFDTSGRFMADAMAITAFTYWIFKKACEANDCDFVIDVEAMLATLAVSAEETMAVAEENEAPKGMGLINEFIHSNIAGSVFVYPQAYANKAGERIGGNERIDVRCLGSDRSMQVVFDYNRNKLYIRRTALKEFAKKNGTTVPEIARSVPSELLIHKEATVNLSKQYADVPLKVGTPWIILHLDRVTSGLEESLSSEQPPE